MFKSNLDLVQLGFVKDVVNASDIFSQMQYHNLKMDSNNKSRIDSHNRGKDQIALNRFGDQRPEGRKLRNTQHFFSINIS